MDYQALKQAAQELEADLVTLRREFHRFPELSGQEQGTSERVARYLFGLGLKVQAGVAGHGVVALLEGSRPGRTAMVRADMDALPVTEATGLDYASVHPGVMHACGHDVHMAVALGVAQVLSRQREQLCGAVKFVFQPAEEVPPGGAQPMIAAGVLDAPPVSGAFALHVYPYLTTGTVGVKDGPLFSQADDFDFEVTGRGGHGALPHQGADAIAAACELVTAVQVARTRRLDPVEPAVISFGRLTGGTQRNVLCPKVRIEGTARAASRDIASQFPDLLRNVADGVATAHAVNIQLHYMPGYPPLVNAAHMNDHVRGAVGDLWGADGLIELQAPLLAGEDFAYFARAVPSAMFLLGVHDPDTGAPRPLHHPEFRADERALVTGAGTLAAAVGRFCAPET